MFRELRRENPLIKINISYWKLHGFTVPHTLGEKTLMSLSHVGPSYNYRSQERNGENSRLRQTESREGIDTFSKSGRREFARILRLCCLTAERPDKSA